MPAPEMTINKWSSWDFDLCQINNFDAFHLEHIEEEEDEHMHLVSLKVFQETSWWKNLNFNFCQTIL